MSSHIIIYEGNGLGKTLHVLIIFQKITKNCQWTWVLSYCIVDMEAQKGDFITCSLNAKGYKTPMFILFSSLFVEEKKNEFKTEILLWNLALVVWHNITWKVSNQTPINP